MPGAPLVDAVLCPLREIARRLPPPAVRRLHVPKQAAAGRTAAHAGEFCALELDDGAFGLSFLLLGDALEGLATRHGGRRQGLPLAGASALQLAQGLASPDTAARALGLAACNALTHSAWRRLGWRPPDAGNALGDLALGPADHLGMIGAFAPLIPMVRATGAGLTVIELDAAKARALGEAFPWAVCSQDRRLLARCNKILGTASMLQNGTLEGMLAASQAARQFVLVGPSAGLWPDALFARGVTAIAGTLVEDGAAFADAMARGAPWGAAARKFSIAREGWPGWPALLQPAGE